MQSSFTGYAISSSDGVIYYETNKTKVTDCVFGCGDNDVIGCGYNWKYNHFFFTLNGKPIGFIFPSSVRAIAPAISFYDFDAIYINNGERPFKFNLYNEDSNQDNNCVIT